jgi:hypothetical protein
VTDNTDAVAWIDDLTFWGGEGEVGFFIEPEGFTGWEDAPPTRSENLERIGDGAHDAAEFYEARVLTLAGLCRARSGLELGAMRNDLFGALQGLKRVDVAYQGPPAAVWGRRFGEPMFRTILPGRIARYQFSVRCPDPLKYGELREFPSTGNQLVEFWHRGNFAAPPVHVVSGEGGGYTINGPDEKRFTVRAPVAPGSPHTIDMSTGQISIDGTVRYGLVDQADTWVARPRTQEVTRLDPSYGAISMVTRTKDTWI